MAPIFQNYAYANYTLRSRKRKEITEEVEDKEQVVVKEEMEKIQVKRK